MPSSLRRPVDLRPFGLSRRLFVQQLSAVAASTSLVGFRAALAAQAEELRQQGRSVILLWMAGGPSQFETFDPKPDHANSGGTGAIQTCVPGVHIAEGWEPMADVMNHVALIRSMNNKEGNHQRATYQMHTGYLPSGSVQHPSIGSSIVQQSTVNRTDLPAFVSIGKTIGAGFLGVDHEPFNVQTPGEMPQNLRLTQSPTRLNRRRALLSSLEGEFAARGAHSASQQHRQLYQKAAELALSPATSVFDLENEPDAVRAQYGESDFGKGCLLARRLTEAGVTFVEVRSGGWDTHTDNFATTAAKAGEVAPAAAALLKDLHLRGRLDNTLVIWTGEFGRTPTVNPRGGRDHFPRAYTSWMAGCGVKGGQVIGKTTADGSAIADRPVSVPDFLQSICSPLGIDASTENISPQGRPMKIVDGGEVIPELFS